MRNYFSKESRRDFIELVLLPGCALILPWSLSFRIMRWLAFHCTFLYKDSVDKAFSEAKKRNRIKDHEDFSWKSERRLVTLIDHADMYLSMRYGDRFVDKYLDVKGEWPILDRAAIVCTFHWGAGMWGLYHARMSGLKMVPLIAPMDKNSEYFYKRPVLYRYVKKRVEQINNALIEDSLDVSTKLRFVLKALKNKKQILFLADVPADQASSSISTRIGTETVFVPKGMLKRAVDEKIEVVYYIVGINLISGRRFLRIEKLGIFDDLQNLTDSLFDRLNGLINEKNVAWHFWSEMPRFISK